MNSQTNTLSFDVIPVIDLLAGQVVRARRGEREAYRPIVSSLCDGSAPAEVARALSAFYSFKTLYIADLDAIQRRGSQLAAVASIQAALPGIDIWVDAGASSAAEFAPWQALGVRCVIGSENQSDAAQVLQLVDRLGPQQAVLSLDFAQGTASGPAALFETACDWPERVIAMTLGRVGSYQGPDCERLRQIQALAPHCRIHAAGGVRDADDLETLRAMNLAGALLASALHDRRISPQQFARYGQ